MNQKTLLCAFVFLALSCAAAAAGVPKDMIGKWRYQDFTIEVSECRTEQVCAKVIAGPKNVGMEIFASKLVAKGGGLQGQIIEPETKQLYYTQFRETDADTWHLYGCTAAGVCLSMEFVRIK